MGSKRELGCDRNNGGELNVEENCVAGKNGWERGGATLFNIFLLTIN